MRSLLARLRARRFPFVAVIVGLESGQVHRLGFVEFRSAGAGRAWCDRMNAAREELGEPLTRFDIRPR